MPGQSGCSRSKWPTSSRLSALCQTSEFGANPAVAELVGCSAGGTANRREGGGAGAGGAGAGGAGAAKPGLNFACRKLTVFVLIERGTI